MISPAGRASKSILIHCTSLRTERPMPVAADSSSGGGYASVRDFSTDRLSVLLDDCPEVPDSGADLSLRIRPSSLGGRGTTGMIVNGLRSRKNTAEITPRLAD